MFLNGRGNLARCLRQEETRDKKVPVVATRSGPLAGKLVPECPEWSGCQSQQRRVPARVAICCRKADPFQGPKLGSCLTLGNELSKETHLLTKQEILLGKGIRVESSRVREPRISNCQHLLDHGKSKSSRKTSISALLTMPKPLTVWITINCGKF